MQIIGCQTDIVWEDKEANHARVRELLAGARIAPGALVLLPEMFATGYSMHVDRIAERDNGPTHTFLSNLARQLEGFVVGGVVSYLLNRRHTFASDRPHEEAGWRFALVAAGGFGLTYLLMSLFVERLGAPYLPAQLVTTVLIMFVTFFANRAWTFARA